MRVAEVRQFLRHFPPTHELLYASRFIGLRDRFRCPGCRAVGTWKPHGGALDQLFDRWISGQTTRPVRRWVCKYCGRYEGPEGTLQSYPDPVRGSWVLPAPHDPESEEEPGPTPEDAVRGKLGSVWPWRG